MYTTTYKKWATSLTINAIVIGLLVAGVLFAVPHTLEIGVFFLWWTSVLGAVAFLFVLFVPTFIESTIKEGETLLSAMRNQGLENTAKYHELYCKAESAKDTLSKLWTDKLVNNLACSRTYMLYHWVTDIVVWMLLIISSNYGLATVRVFVFLLSCLVVGTARKLYRERNGLPDPAVSVHVVQTNNVAGGDIAGGNIYK